jgi:hypothetical protein
MFGCGTVGSVLERFRNERDQRPMGSVSVIDTAKTTAVSVTQNSVMSLTTGESKPGGVIDTDK